MKTSIKRALGSALAGTTALTGALAMGSVTTAEGAVQYANYGFEGSAFGTFVSTGPVGVQSGRTAHSFIACTRRIGVNVERSVAAAQTPGVPRVLNIGAVDSFSRSYRTATGTVGSRSQNVIAGVLLGDPDGPHLKINALKTRTDAFATKAGKFGTRAKFTSAEIVAKTGQAEIDDAIDGLGINNLISQVTSAVDGMADDVLVIPGLGEIKVGGVSHKKFYTFAEANATALNVQLYGANAVKGGGDDVIVRIGRSRSRITRNLPSGVFRGFAQPATANLLDGLLTVGPLGEQRLGCHGTNGLVKRNPLVGMDVLNQGMVTSETLEGSAFGKQYSDGSAKAWTQARVEGFKLGSGDQSLAIETIVGRANVTKWRSGTVTRGIGGSKVLSIIVNGEEHPIPADRTIEIPGLAKVEFMIVSRPTRRDIKVTAVRITLVPAAAENTGVAVINLGVAKAGITDF